MQPVWPQDTRGLGMKRVVLITLAGIIIIGGAITSTRVEFDCSECAAGVIDCDECRNLVRCSRCEPMTTIIGLPRGSPDCPECKGLGVVTKSTGSIVLHQDVECGCRGADPECRICRGHGSYPSRTTGLCDACEGKGGSPCPNCGGMGTVKASTILVRALQLR